MFNVLIFNVLILTWVYPLVPFIPLYSCIFPCISLYTLYSPVFPIYPNIPLHGSVFPKIHLKLNVCQWDPEPLREISICRACFAAKKQKYRKVFLLYHCKTCFINSGLFYTKFTIYWLFKRFKECVLTCFVHLHWRFFSSVLQIVLKLHFEQIINW
jgi:hypothetical protein